MTDTELRAVRVFQVVSEFCDDMPIAQLQGTATLEGLGLDSLDRLELLMAIEAEFGAGLEFTEEEDDALSAPTTTVAQLVQAVDSHLSPKGQPA